MTNTVTMTAEEAEQLFEAAKYALEKRQYPNDDHKVLKRAINKLRTADVILIEPPADEEDEK